MLCFSREYRKEGRKINNIYIFALLVLLAPMTYAEPTSFTLMDSMPQNITGGSLTGANYTLFYSDPTQSIFVLSINAGNNFSENMTEYPLRYLTFDGEIIPNCTEWIQDNLFVKTCDRFADAGEHNLGFFLKPALAIAPDTIEYSLNVMYFSEEEYRSSRSHYHPYNITVNRFSENDTFPIEPPVEYNESEPIESPVEYNESEPIEPPVVLGEEIPEKKYQYVIFLIFMSFFIFIFIVVVYFSAKK